MSLYERASLLAHAAGAESLNPDAVDRPRYACPLCAGRCDDDLCLRCVSVTIAGRVHPCQSRDEQIAATMALQLAGTGRARVTTRDGEVVWLYADARMAFSSRDLDEYLGRVRKAVGL